MELVLTRKRWKGEARAHPMACQAPIAVNSIRSNAVGTHKAGPAVFRRRLERTGNGAPR